MVLSRTIEWGLERVGFDLQQPHPIMRRLNGLRLVEACNLISCAKLFLKVKRLLYEQTNCLWPGGYYKRQLFYAVQDVELDDEAKIVFLPWHLDEGKPVISRALIMGRIVTGGKIVSGCSQPALRKSADYRIFPSEGSPTLWLSQFFRCLNSKGSEKVCCQHAMFLYLLGIEDAVKEVGVSYVYGVNWFERLLDVELFIVIWIWQVNPWIP